MKAVITIALFACIAIASADWLVKTPCGSTNIQASVEATNGNCVHSGKGVYYLVQTTSATSAADYYCSDDACKKCVKERTYNLGSCSGVFTYATTANEPTYANYITGDYYVARQHTADCKSTVAESEAVALNTCYKTSAYGSMQYQCSNNMLVTLNYENSACLGSAFDTTSFSVPSCQASIFSGATDFTCYKKN